MSLASWFQPPRRTLTLFVCLMTSLGGALGWFAWQLLERERLLERSQLQDRLEQAADGVAERLHGRVDGLRRLASLSTADISGVPDDVIVLRAREAEFAALPTDRLVYYPAAGQAQGPPLLPGASVPPLAEAERAEFERNDPGAAAALYRVAAQVPAPPVRAAALLGLGRSLRKAGRAPEALDAYAALAKLGDVDVAGRPAELAALEGRCSTLADLRRDSELRDEADRLTGALWSGRWRLTRAAWEFQLEQAGRWDARRSPDARERRVRALSAAADMAATHLSSEPRPAGQLALRADGEPALVVWVTAPAGRTLVVAGPDFVRAAWADAVAGHRVSGQMVDAERQIVAGGAIAADAPRATRTIDGTGLPWSVTVASADPSADQALVASRRRLLIASFAIVAAALLAGSFFILRSIQREREVARLQSDFVSAVSHEFRTPLTAVRQLSEMLAKDRVQTDALRRESYEILSRESDRLHRLVESILDFGRLEAGTFRYQLEPVDVASLVRDVVAEIEPAAAAAGFTIEVTAPASGLAVTADREALALAIRNLLENAVKYSGESRRVHVEATREGGRIWIAVRDWGVGIPAGEQRVIYRKFVRGAGARKAGIPGTGIGLTIAAQVVAAHRGRIHLQSEPGAGSTFTIDLPAGGGAATGR